MSEMDGKWSQKERNFCVKQFKLNNHNINAVKEAYWEVYCEKQRRGMNRKPTTEQIERWWRLRAVDVEHTPSDGTTPPKLKEPQESNKLQATYWKRKRGENRILRTDSISSDIGPKLQAIKWKQRDIKWSGPRPIDKKEELVKPVQEKRCYNNYNKPKEEVKPNKSKYLCCSSLAVLCYLMKDYLIEILEVMRMYETIFSRSYPKDDGSVNVSGAAVEEGAWHAAALDGWALLLPLLSRSHALSLLNNQAPSFARLGELLETVSLEVRMAAGGALAIAYETVTDDDADNALCAHVDELLPRLSELARDSHKFRAKRDRKIQRATFRDILKYFEEGSVPSMSVRIGSETASWSSWSGGAAYAALAGALGGALQVLAPRDPRLRAALGLSDALPDETEPQEKPKRLQRHLQNRETCKARDFTRSRHRDKRSTTLDI